MKKAYKTPVVKVIITEAEELICESLGVGKSTSKMDGKITADSKYRDFNDYEEFDEEAYEEDLW